MSVHLERQIDRVKKLLLSLSAMVEETLDHALRAAEQVDADLAQRVIDDDQQIDLMEVEVEEECLHTLALHQPVAADLRFVVVVLKINNELERIGDLCVNIAEQARLLAAEADVNESPLDLRAMGRIVREMLNQSLKALIEGDSDLAKSIIQTDERIDRMHRDTYFHVETLIRENPHQVDQMIQLLSISRQLERIADHCVNIAEDVVYMALGHIERHKHGDIG